MQNTEPTPAVPRTLPEIAADIADCTRCDLHKTRRNTVPGFGPERCKLMMIGEGPGEHEDREGRPFVGPAGNELDKMLKDSGIKRSDMFITNVVKCRPPKNRNPTPEETAACRPWLEEQIAALKPDLIITMGAPATSWFKPGAKISQVRGRIEKVGPDRMILPVFHTAYALRRPAAAHAIAEDFASAARWLEVLAIDPDEPNPYAEEAEPEKPAIDEKLHEPEVSDLPSRADRRGPILETTEWVWQKMQSLPRVNSDSGDSRKARHQMNFMAVIIRSISRMVNDMPEDSEYLNHLVRPRLEASVAAGKCANQFVTHVCNNCHAAFYAPDEENTKRDLCSDCE